jgi:signal transduction histidine kinase
VNISLNANGKSVAGRYGLAVLAAVVALLLRRALTPLLGENNPYHTVWAAVVFAAWYCGTGPAIVATLMSLLGVWYWFIPTHGSYPIEEPKHEISGMFGFVVLSGLIVALGETNRRSAARSEKEIAERKRAQDELRRAHDQLETRVAERTAELNSVNENLRALSAQLQQAQDEERRRLARELHDSAGQLLAAIKMNLGAVQAMPLTTEVARLIADNSNLVDQVTREIRTVSYLLHPPLLEMAGLASALRFYVDGFVERSKIAVDVDIPQQLDRLSDATEIALFRVAQECLTNIHRHSGSPTATIRITQEDGQIQMQVGDAGKGIPAEKRIEQKTSGGIGFRGMRERIAQLGGSLEVESDRNGTVVTAILPASKATAAATNEETAAGLPAVTYGKTNESR